VIDIAEIEAARDRIAGIVVRTPLVRLRFEDPDREIYCKLENVQPINSFKLRGAANAILKLSPESLAEGLVTASAGNMAQGVAWMARELGVSATIVVPDHAPEAKLDAIAALGGRVVKVPMEAWWQTIVTSHMDGINGRFVHPVDDEGVMAGNGTIGLEILEDLPEVDTIVIPVGGGGLATGIASAIRARRPQTRIVTVEPDTGAALAGAMAAGHPTDVAYTPSLVDGSGSRRVLDPMWPRLSEVVDEAVSVSIPQVSDAIALLARRMRVIAEGAGALSTAAATAGLAGTGRIACIVSGGNINLTTFQQVLKEHEPADATGV
jgi:threonine dehydratase